MIVFGLIVGALFVVWVRHRAVSKDARAGLVSERPVFSVPPPARRMGSRGRERL